MSFIRKIKKGDKTYLAEVENRRVEGKVVQRFIRYVGKQADGRTVLSTSLSDVEVAEVKLYGPLLVLHYLADLGAYQRAHPVANPTDPITGDFEPDGTWYSMIALRGDLYAVEPNHGELDKITTRGRITRVIDISASQGHVVPTSIADLEQHRDHGEQCEIARGGVFYVGNLGQFDPDQLNTQSIFRITQSGHLKVVATGFSKVLGVAIDGRDRLYVLESSYSTTDPGPEPFTGRLIRILPNGKQEILIDSTSGVLVFPTGMTFGPDGNLYVSNYGFGFPDGAGQILKITLRHED